MVEQLIPIFCDIDDFCKEYEAYCTQHLLMDKQQIIPKTSMSLAAQKKLICIIHKFVLHVLFHLGNKLNTTLPKFIEQFWRYIAFVSKQFPKHFAGQKIKNFPVTIIHVASSYIKKTKFHRDH